MYENTLFLRLELIIIGRGRSGYSIAQVTIYNGNERRYWLRLLCVVKGPEGHILTRGEDIDENWFALSYGQG